MDFNHKLLIFSADIDFNYDRQNKDQHLSRRYNGRHLRNEGKCYNERSDRAQESDWDQVLAVATDVIEQKLSESLTKIIGVPVESKILTVHDGSLIIFFGIALTSYNIISNYKNFYESAQLIEHQCKLLLKEALKTTFGESFDIRINYEAPIFNDSGFDSDRHLFEKLRYYVSNSLTSSQVPSRRDGFFYYLIFLNIALIIIIAILVYKAVTKTYFM